MRVHLGLGSNLGDRWAYLGAAVAGLREIAPDLKCSPVYETDPVGGPQDQRPYLNCVVSFESTLTPVEILDLCHRLEQRAHRVRRERDGPRTLDVDVLLIEGYESDDPLLTVPHPRLFTRAFVLCPLEDLDEHAVPAGWRERLGGREAVEASVRRVGELIRS